MLIEGEHVAGPLMLNISLLLLLKLQPWYPEDSNTLKVLLLLMVSLPLKLMKASGPTSTLGLATRSASSAVHHFGVKRMAEARFAAIKEALKAIFSSALPETMVPLFFGQTPRCCSSSAEAAGVC